MTLQRAGDEGGAAVAPFFPGRREEGWWLVLGTADTGRFVAVFCNFSFIFPILSKLTPRLDAIKRVVQQQASASYQLEFTPPAAGPQTYKLYLMSDAYMGCDQEYDVAVTAGEGAMEAD